jgi:SAM-dependent methyltransferase
MDDASLAWDPLGRALRAYLGGARDELLQVSVDGGEEEVLPAATFFRESSAFEPWEQMALAACHGRVLDLGAGAGCHALALQALGLTVAAVDVSEGAVEVMTSRGVRDARPGTAADVHDGPYDTVLLLMHGAGLGGDLAGLAGLLTTCRRLLAPGGAILMDSADPRGCVEPGEDDPDLDALPLELRGDVGVAAMSLTWNGITGATFPWIYLSARALAELARPASLASEVLWVGDEGHYVACLRASQQR